MESGCNRRWCRKPPDSCVWLGLDVEPDTNRGLEVIKVYPEGPLVGKIMAGDRLIALRSPASDVSLKGYDPGYNSHAETTFQGYADYVRRQRDMAQVLDTGNERRRIGRGHV